MPSRPAGSIIGLRPEYASRYRVLHRHVFPAVLDRIARSRIGNYSIYLYDGVLFSHLEYFGDDYDADLSAMAADETTREWWTLTDPMQVPLEERAAGEWWAKLSLVYAAERRDGRVEAVTRHAIVAPAPVGPPDGLEQLLAGVVRPGVATVRAFRSRDRLYLYIECLAASAVPLAAVIADGLRLGEAPVEMEEVFHTDGAAVPIAAARQAAGEPRPKKVFVSGCFDLLHSGHVAFLESAARLGELHVGIGSDETIHRLKGRYTVYSQAERQYMLSALACVTQCRINRGSGLLDFEDELHDLRPDRLVVNEDGHSPAKEALCRRLGIEYRVLQRVPRPGLPGRTTTALRAESRIPFRIDLAGGWLDQPFVSCHHPGPVVTISIEPTIEFNDRSGMASSTRRKAIELWHGAIPPGDPEQLARLLFSFENPPGTREVAGSQDALGIVLPGLNRLDYQGGYWPDAIESCNEEAVLSWLEDRLHLVTLEPRASSFRVLDEVRVDAEGARALAAAAEDCWRAILARDARAFGDAFRRSFEAQVAMFPLMMDAAVRDAIAEASGAAVLGWKVSGAGGGGYLILVAEAPPRNTVGVKIRRRASD